MVSRNNYPVTRFNLGQFYFCPNDGNGTEFPDCINVVIHLVQPTLNFSILLFFFNSRLGSVIPAPEGELNVEDI